MARTQRGGGQGGPGDGSGLLVYPDLGTRSGLVAELGVLAVGVVVFVVVWVAGPWLWWLAAPMIALLGYLGWVRLTARTWIEPRAGVVLRRRWTRHATRLPLSDVREIRVEPRGGGGGSALALHTAHHPLRLPLVSVTLFSNRTQSAAMLRTLADMLAEHLLAAVAQDVPRRLVAQAKHVEGGGSAETSPLATGTVH